LDGAEEMKCPVCGRKLYPDRPSCLYCDYERPLDDNVKTLLKKRLVAKSLGMEESAAEEATTVGGVCPACGRKMKPEAKFCPGCGARADASATPVPAAGSAPPATKSAPSIDRIDWKWSSSHLFNKPAEVKLSIGNILWTAGIFLALASTQLPFGVVPEERTMLGLKPQWPVPFPAELLIPLIVIAAMIPLSILNFVFPGGIQGKFFRRGFVIFWLLFIFLFLKGLYTGSSGTIFAVIAVLAVSFAGKRMRARLDLYEPYSAAALLMCSVTFLISLSLRNELLSKAGAGVFSGGGFPALILALAAIIAGSVFKAAELQEAGTGRAR